MADRFVEMTALYDEHADSVELQLGTVKAGQKIVIKLSHVLNL